MARKIGVIGAGVMGLDIALEYVLADFEVLIFDRFEGNPDFKKDKQDKMWRLLFLAMKNRRELVYRTDEALESAMARITWLDSSRNNFGQLAECEAVIEAIIEDVELKHKLIRDIESVCDVPVPFLTNTSTLTIKLLADASKRPELVMGFHFFNPVRMMKLVEGIPSDQTSEEVIAKAKELAGVIGKQFELVPDLPGFVVNRLLLPMIESSGNFFDGKAGYKEIDESFRSGKWAENEMALEIVYSHIIAAHDLLQDQENSRVKLSNEQIDRIVKLGTNFPAGPFELKEAIEKGETGKLKFYMGPAELCDLVGIDVAIHCLQMLRFQEPNRWGEVPNILKRLSGEKKLGRKTGEGFYSSVDVDTVKMSKGGNYARVVLRENVVSHNTVKQIKKVFDSLRDDEIKAVVFEITKCRGADVSEFPLVVKNPDLAKTVIGDWHAMIKTIMNFPKPAIAVVRGAAWGGGYELAQACDYIIASKNTKLSQPEVLLGIMPGGGGTQNLTRRVGLLNSVSMILDPKKEVEASKPWVDEVIDEITPEHLETFINNNATKMDRPVLKLDSSQILETEELFINLRQGFAKHPPVSFDTAFFSIFLGNHADLNEGLNLEEKLIVMLFNKVPDEIKEGIRARFERREPQFEGTTKVDIKLIKRN